MAVCFSVEFLVLNYSCLFLLEISFHIIWQLMSMMSSFASFLFLDWLFKDETIDGLGHVFASATGISIMAEIFRQTVATHFEVARDLLILVKLLPHAINRVCMPIMLLFFVILFTWFVFMLSFLHIIASFYVSCLLCVFILCFSAVSHSAWYNILKLTHLCYATNICLQDSSCHIGNSSDWIKICWI